MIPVGIHYGLPEDQYHARELGVASKSALDKLAKSAAHYRAWAMGLTDDDATPALNLGRAIHCAQLEPTRFAREYVAAPEFGDCRKTDRTTSEKAKENKTRRDAWRAEHVGEQMLSADEARTIRGMVESVLAHPIAAPLFDGGEPEASLSWIDPETGVACKARADYYVPSLETCVDLKSTLDASEEGFEKSARQYRYHWQSAHYQRGFAALGRPLDHFIFVPVEKSPPYAVGVYSLDQDAEVLGFESTAKLLRRMGWCLAEGRWPAYEDRIKTVSLSKWVTR